MPKLKLPGWNGLILAMMYEDSQPASHWRTYLDILPRSLNTPVFWTDSQLKQLTGSTIVDHIGARTIKSEYNTYIAPLLKKTDLYTVPATEIAAVKAKYFNFEQYKRFGSLIMAYSFTDDEDRVAMVPMADMLNHRTGFNNARLYFNQEDESAEAKPEAEIPESVEAAKTKTNKKAKTSDNDFLHMRTRRAIEPEEELYNTYGTLPDGELLRKYGYVEDLGKNRWNDVEISVAHVIASCANACGWDEPEVKKRKSFIRDNALVDPSGVMDFYLHQESFGDFDPLEADDAVEGGLRPDLIAIAKIFACTPEDWIGAASAILESKKQREAEMAAAGDDDEYESDDEGAEEGNKHNDAHGTDKHAHDHHQHGEAGHVHTDACAVKDDGEHHDEAKKAEEGEHKEEEPQPQRKSGGDLIPINDPSKLTNIVKSVFTTKMEQYGADFATQGKSQLEALPKTGTPEATEDVLRTRAALILKLGEIQILESLIADAESLSK